jgi:hypothetical protein
MGYDVWFGTGDNDCTHLGAIGRVPQLMAQIANEAKAEIDSDRKYGSLFGITFACDDSGDEPLPNIYLVKVKKQAKKFLTSHGKNLSGEARNLLHKLASLPVKG